MSTLKKELAKTYAAYYAATSFAVSAPLQTRISELETMIDNLKDAQNDN